MRILWIGPFYSDWSLCNKRSVNLAAVRWTRGLLTGLRNCGAEIFVVSHCPEQSWPHGPVVWQDAAEKYFDDSCTGSYISYPNIKHIRDIYLADRYAQRTRDMIKRYKIDVVLTYNCMHRWCVAAAKSARERNVPVCQILLDGDDPRTDQWRAFNEQTRYASGIVFLSYWAYRNFNRIGVSKLHMDGGSDQFVDNEPRDINRTCRSIVYTGALDKWRGLDFLRGVVSKLKRDDVVINLCGNFDVAEIGKVFGEDKRVRIKGLLDTSCLDLVCREADLFINVRDPGIGQNIINYPSKIPQYLRYGRPVVSTWLESFSPDYRGVLSVVDNNDDVSFVRKINDVLSMTHTALLAKYHEIKRWYECNKLWDVQAEHTLDFMRTLK